MLCTARVRHACYCSIEFPDLCSMFTVTSDVILSSYIELAMHRHNLRKRVGLWGSRPPLFGGYRPPTS